MSDQTAINILQRCKHAITHSDPSIYHRMMAEFTGCMMFHFLGSISPTAAANGISLMVIVYYTAKLSGAHLNPAVSLTFCILGHTNPIEMLLYWISQIAGCAVGALWISALVPEVNIRDPIKFPGEAIEHHGCFTPNERINDAQVFGWEALCTFCFISHIFSVVWYTQNKNGYGNTGPLIVGLSLFANALACGSFTGGALNPARVLGSQIVYNCPYRKVYTYIFGEITGAIFAALAIIPWYGISVTPWYSTPKMMAKVATNSQNSIILKTLARTDHHRYSTNMTLSILEEKTHQPSLVSPRDDRNSGASLTNRQTGTTLS